jgi:hypothetical protein
LTAAAGRSKNIVEFAYALSNCFKIDLVMALEFWSGGAQQAIEPDTPIVIIVAVNSQEYSFSVYL